MGTFGQTRLRHAIGLSTYHRHSGFWPFPSCRASYSDAYMCRPIRTGGVCMHHQRWTVTVTMVLLSCSDRRRQIGIEL